MPAPTHQIRRRRRIIKGACQFCNTHIEPNYQAFEQLSRFLSERGRILGRINTAVCAKHQRIMAREIKRARHLGLLKFVTLVS